MESTIKTLTITGSAASVPDVKPRRGTTKRKIPKPDEEESEDVAQKFVISKVETQLKPRIREPVKTIFPQPQAQSQPIPQPIPQPQPQPAPQVQPQPQIKPKEITSVTLNPPKARVKLMPKAPIKPMQAQLNQTRKVRRVQLPNLSNRITRAKKIYSETKKTPIDTIKNYLIEKGVIQAKSKAPETMLRSMYGDFNMLKDGHAL
jgi:hypothetical protein